MVDTKSLFILIPLLAMACASDVARRRIPNWLTIMIAITGIASQAMAAGLSVALCSVAAALVIFALAFPFWAMRLMGGGDLKLAAATATWVGLARSPRYLLASALLGGVIAVICYAASPREARLSAYANLCRLHAPALPHDVQAPSNLVLVPYGVAFAVGALVAMRW